MNLHQKIVAARIKNGLTQEQLADMCGVTARTIQRVETGATVPRSFTLKAIASALQIPFEELSNTTAGTDNTAQVNNIPEAFEEDNDRYFLKMLCLSCFGYLLIPYLHFLIPAYLLKKERVKNPLVLGLARKIVQWQVYWVVAGIFIFLAALGYNMAVARRFNQSYLISYVLVFFTLYIANAILIGLSYRYVSKAVLNTQKAA
jgi:transcriptional regulator with XRE-family HTH domain